MTTRFADFIAMPKQNRVTPFGELVAVPERGAWLGNRGCLHNEQEQIVRQWKLKAWIICRLHYKDWQRSIMSPNRWTELFFMDEATALAAGHRPCALCRREDYNRFTALWREANPDLWQGKFYARTMDAVIHHERIEPGTHKKRTHLMPVASLPNGALVSLADQAYLVWEELLALWTPGGYTEQIARPQQGQIAVITPLSIVRTIAAGYQPQTATI